MAKLSEKLFPSQQNFNLLISVGQFLGLLPINIINKETMPTIGFNIFSFTALYSIFHIVLQSTMVFMCFLYGYHIGFNFRHIIKVTFYSCNLWILLEYFRLAQKWSKLMKVWNKIDSMMEPRYEYSKDIRKKIKIWTTFAFFYAIAQIGCYIGYNYYLSVLKSGKPVENEDAAYFTSTCSQIFTFMTYKLWIGIICQVNYIFTFIRFVYSDLFVSLTSSFISERFKQITKRLRPALKQKKTVQFWREVREDYNNICDLFRVTNSYLSNVIFINFTSNLILMLTYMRSSTIANEMGVTKIYNIICFGIVFIRTLIMLICLASVNETSKEPAEILNSVSSSQYNTEIQRFLMTINFDEIVFKFNNMFNMNRPLILNLLGVILTYELVLVQFAESDAFKNL